MDREDPSLALGPRHCVSVDDGCVDVQICTKLLVSGTRTHKISIMDESWAVGKLG